MAVLHSLRRSVQHAISDRGIEVLDAQYQEGTLQPREAFREALMERLWTLLSLKRDLEAAPPTWGLRGHVQGERPAFSL